MSVKSGISAKSVEPGKVHGAQYMLVSDLDGTLLGNMQASRRFADWYARAAQRLLLVYSSGRTFASLVQAFEAASLPEPAVVISDVGTMIRTYPDGELLNGWCERISEGWNVQNVKRLLEREERLMMQPEESQSEFKASYFFKNATRQDIADLKTRLQTSGIEAQIVYSSHRDLDILPAGANKGTAAAFVAMEFGIPFDHVVAAGDSGNDRSMLSMGWSGIVVANAQPELSSVQDPQIYHARSAYADGVIEGTEHWLAQQSREA